MKTLLLIAALFLTGCAPATNFGPVLDQPVEIPDGVPEPLFAHVMTMAKTDQRPVLSALVVLVQADMIGEWAWTAPTTGTAVAYYQVKTMADVAAAAIYVMRSGKSNITVTVRGVDADGNIGNWSAMSDTTQAVEW